INTNLLKPEEKEPKYVQLSAQFGHFQEVKQVSKVSFLSGYIFIQTDKPMYNPGDTVRCRAFISNADFQASDGTIFVEIQNPDGITVYTTQRSKAANGILSTTYGLSDIVKEGRWKVVAKFDHWKENTFSAAFEVKKYVLPAFNVTLIPKKTHLSLDDQELNVEIYARYVYGEKVDGVAYVVFGLERNGQKVRLPSMKQVQNLDGGIATLTTAELKDAYPDLNSLEGSSIYVRASVLTSSGGDLVDAEKTGIKIVLAPYLLTIKDTPRFFKSGLPFKLTVTVSHHDGSPAPNVPVQITFLSSPITVHSGTIKASLNMPSDMNPVTLIAETVIPDVKQTKAEWVVEPYSPFNSDRINQLYVTLDTNTVKAGQTLNLKLHLSTFSLKERSHIKHVSYIVLNKGRIIRAGRVSVGERELINVPLLLTSEMLPAFRFVAYYVLPWDHRVEVVADSVSVDVESQCVGSLKLETFSGKESPGDSFSFQVSGDPGAKVSLVAVDNSIFLLSKSRLTQRKIWDTLRQGDLGCSPGGGKNSRGVFLDAGLKFQSSFSVATDENQVKPCDWKSRRKRSAEQLRLREQLEKSYSSDQFLQRCCSDGMREIPMPYSCLRRALYITEGWNCVRAFLKCCSEYRGEELGIITPPPTTPKPTLPVPTTTISTVAELPGLIRGDVSMSSRPGARERYTGGPYLFASVSHFHEVHPHVEKETVPQIEDNDIDIEDIDEDFELDDIYVRTKFLESWLWTDVTLPEAPKADGLAVATVESALPDSITEWGIMGISASYKTGFCVAEPLNIRAWKPFFIDLRLPRTAARNEHVEVRAVLHNYMNKDMKVLVVLAKTQDICSVAFTEDHKQEVLVRARSSVLIPYTVIPLRAGELPLQVTAVSSFTGQDAIRKNLRVVVEGIQKMDARSFVLNPADKGDSDGNQLIQVDKAQLGLVVPNSLPETFVNVRGNLLADSIDNSINKDALASLIQMPGGCVEQNLAKITLPLIASHYLDRSAQWEHVGLQRREDAMSYIKQGYENQLHYRKTDDSYPPYRNEGSSTWITAFVVKVFSMAHPFITVDDQHICGPLLYLLKHKQLPSGAFREDNPVYTTSMTGGLQGAESQETLTAFVLIALTETQSVVTCIDPDVNTEERFTRAGEYLKERYRWLNRPYSVAIVCYALAVSNQGCSKSTLLNAASPDRTHWPDADNSLFTLEATGYALLALIKGGHFEEAAAPFKWLTRQRRIGGGYGSTQSTMVVLQALSEYLVKKPPPPDMNLRVDLSVPGRSGVRWAFTHHLAHVARSSRVPLDQDFTVLASGNGQGVLEVVTVYNELPDVQDNSSCNGFHLNVSIMENREKPPADVEKVYKLTINVRALSQHQVRMAVLDISLPTGFEPETSDLELLSNSVDRYINNFQVVDNLSDRGSLIIHLFKVSNKEPDIISFRLNQKFKVGLLQPSTVTVYEYYNTDKRCSRFYTPPEDKEQLSQICKDNICRCTQGDCCVLKTGSYTVSARMKAACSGIHNVFKVRVVSTSTSQYDRYQVEILQVIKEGSEVGLKEKDTREFLSQAGCRAGLNLITGQDYLIIAPSSNIWQAGSDKHGFVLVAPSVLRVQHKENILLEAFGLSETISVGLSVYDFPVKSRLLWRGIIKLNSDNNYSFLQSIQINPSLLTPEEKGTEYVQLVAQFGQYEKVEHVSKVSFQSGYIFIQTDKPVYNPGDTVRCRAFVSNADFQASDGTISVEIQNPDGITVYTTPRSKAANGILSTTYGLSDIVKEGRWKVVAKFDHWKENTFSADFEVKKYVLPAFNVTVIPKQTHFSLEDQELTVEVYASYVYGEKVEGVAYVVFGVERNGQKVRLPSMKQVQNLDGGIATLTIAELKNAYPDINSLVGSSIYVRASVLTSSGSDLVDAEKTGIKIVLAPYLLTIKDTPRFYKSGLPFDIMVTVSHHDGSPARNVPVQITFLSSPITVHSGTIKASLNMPSEMNPVTLIAKTVIPDLKQEQQTTAEWFVEPYSPFNSARMNQLYITLDTNTMQIGQSLNFKLHLSTFSLQERSYIQHVSYIVLNKGRIINAGRVSVEGHGVTNVPLVVTSEMLPAFRFVAYYILPWHSNVEVVADSVSVDVESQCVGSLKLEPFRGEVKDSHSPGESFSFQVRGDPGAKVSLVAVDNSIFLLSKSRLTQRKIWDTLRQGDLGCSPGGGKNSMGVFLDAGLKFQSSFSVATDERQDEPCYWKSRRKRSAEQIRLRDQLGKSYSSDHFLQRCCSDGMREIPMPYSCRRRALYITEAWSCIRAFLECCSKYRGEELGIITPPRPTTPPPIFRETMRRQHFFLGSRAPGQDTPLLSASQPNIREHFESRPRVEEKVSMEEYEDVEEDYDLDQIYVRSKFFESWLWTDVTLPEAPEADGLSVAPVESVLPDSITQWGILGVSTSSKTGFCVAEPFNIRAWKHFFIDLRLPRTAARNEHVEVRAVLHNYMNMNIKVLVILAKTEDFCSVAFTEDHKQEVLVRARSSVLIPYTIIPLRVGKLSLQVTALSSSFIGQDAIRKNLRVVVEGIQKMDVRSFVLNPAEKGDRIGNQLIQVDKAKLRSVVPNSVPETFVNVRGSLLADSIDNSINKDSLAALIRMPGGCVEQNLARITLPLIATHYLDRSSQWENVGLQRREEAISYVKKGFENQLHYRKTDDSYPPYRNEGTSTWITAFVVKVFSMAHPFITVDDQHICGPLLCLLKHKQLSSGAFKEDNPVYTTSMTGGVQGAESQETLTAFVLIALAEAQSVVTCSKPDINTKVRFRRAGEYLKERYQQLRRPYSVAIACYALAVSNQGCSKSVLLKAASPDRTHWPDADNSFFTLEATGYALLALIKDGNFEEAAAPFKWLNQQRRVGGGYGSTQSTMVVLQALSEYLVKKPPPADMSLRVDLSVPGRSDMRWAFTPQLAHVARSSRVPLDQDFTVLASGNGQGVLEVVTVYNELPNEHEKSSCKGFELNVSITENRDKPTADVEKVYKLTINVRALAEHQVRMVVLDISLPTGFEPETSDLELLSNSVDRYINNFQVVDNLSDRGSLIIHLFKVSNKESDTISFRLNQKFKVGLLQPSTVTVYQYYNTDERCSRFYTPPEDKEQLSQICKDNICRCTQGDCCFLKAGTHTVSARKKAACSGIHHAFKVRVLSISTSQYDRYQMEILQVIKEGSEVGLKEKDIRVFLSHAGCRTGLNLVTGQDYLIIGPSSDIWQTGSDENG
ncbi:complement C3-like, partial [Clarias magur]